MLQMPAQLNSFHNGYGARHDECEKDFCSSLLSPRVCIPEKDAAALGKGAGKRWSRFPNFFFWFSPFIEGKPPHIFTSIWSFGGGEVEVDALQGGGFFLRAVAMLHVCMECSLGRRAGKKNQNHNTHLCIGYPFGNPRLLCFRFY